MPAEHDDSEDVPRIDLPGDPEQTSTQTTGTGLEPFPFVDAASLRTRTGTVPAARSQTTPTSSPRIAHGPPSVQGHGPASFGGAAAPDYAPPSQRNVPIDDAGDDEVTRYAADRSGPHGRRRKPVRASSLKVERGDEPRREISVEAVITLKSGEKFVMQTVDIARTSVLVRGVGGEVPDLRIGEKCHVMIVAGHHALDFDGTVMRHAFEANNPSKLAGFSLQIVLMTVESQHALDEIMRDGKSTTRSHGQSTAMAQSRRWLAVLMALGFVALVAAIIATARGINSDAALKVETATVSVEQLPRYARSVGVGDVIPVRRTKIPARFSEPRTVDVRVKIGERVRAGEVLATAEGFADEEARLERLRARLPQMEGTVAVAKHKAGGARPGSPEAKSAAIAISQALGARNQTAAAIRELEAEVKALSITAPYAAAVSDVYVQSGARVDPLSPICELVDDSQMTVRVAFPEADAPLIRPGMRAAIIIPGLQEPLAGVVGRLDAVVRVDEGRRLVHAELAAESMPEVRAGMSATARVTLGGPRDTLVVPARALAKTPEGFVAFVIDDKSRAQERNVDVEIVDQSRFEVRSGLAAGDVVILDPAIDQLRTHPRIDRLDTESP